MARIVLLLVTEFAALVAMLALPIELPWSEPPVLAAMPEELVAAGLVRVVAIGIVAWLLFSTIGYALAAPVPHLRAAAARITAPLVRRFVDTALAATLTVGVATPVGAADAPPEPIVITVEEDSSGRTVVIPPGIAVVHPPHPTVSEPSAPPSPIGPPARSTSPVPLEAAMFVDVAAHVSVEQTYEVEQGDHLWSIAEEILMHRTGRAIVPDHEIARFWHQLIGLNLGSLRSGDPDLIYPGEMLTIPEIAP